MTNETARSIALRLNRSP
ncbi:MAG: hypothetical protein AB8B86_18845 [Pseudomonadales bacterium]